MSKSGELTADEYLSDILKWRDLLKQSSLSSDQKLSKHSSGETMAIERSSVVGNSEDSCHVTPESGIAADSHTYDKAAKKWEKFDVEAALAELSDEEAQDPKPQTTKQPQPVRHQQEETQPSGLIFKTQTALSAELRPICTQRTKRESFTGPHNMSSFGFSRPANPQQQQQKSSAGALRPKNPAHSKGGAQDNDPDGMQQQQEFSAGSLHSNGIARSEGKGEDRRPNGAHSQVSGQPGNDGGKKDALFWKDKGNMAFKAGKWEVAVQAYSRSIEAQHTSVAYANRAMAHLKTGNAQAADEDCSAALALDPAYLKAWHRRFSARRALGRHLDAIDDLEQALRLEPSSKSMTAELRALIAEHEAAAPLKLPSISMAISTGQAQQDLADSKPGVNSETQAAQRAGQIPARAEDAKGPARFDQNQKTSGEPQAGTHAEQAIGLTGSAPGAAGSAEIRGIVHQEASPCHAVGKASNWKAPEKSISSVIPADSKPATIMSPGSPNSSVSATNKPESLSPSAPATPPSAAGTLAELGRAQQEKLKDNERRMSSAQQAPHQASQAAIQQGTFLGIALSGASAGGHVPKIGQLSTRQAQQIVDAAAAGTLQTQQHGGSPLNGTSGRPSTAAATESGASKALAARILQPPKTSSEFEKMWKSLKGDTAKQAAYLRMLQGAPLDKLFKHSLTGSVLSSVLACLLTEVVRADADVAISLLKALPSVPRFEMTMMCLSKQDKAVLCSAWEGAAKSASGPAAQTNLAGLRKAYKL